MGLLWSQEPVNESWKGEGILMEGGDLALLPLLSVSHSLTHSFTHSLDPLSLLRFVLSLNELLVCTFKRTDQAPLCPEAAIKTNGVAD